MTVRELIAELSKCDPDREVFMDDDAITVAVATVIPDRQEPGSDKTVVFLDWRVFK